MLISLHSPRPLHPMSSSFVAPPTPPHEHTLATFSPRTPSPPSHPTTGSNVLMGRSSYHLFVATRSRVIRIFNLPKDASSFLQSLFHPPHAPLTMWTLRQEYGGPIPGDEDSVWAVFKSHDEAATALALSGGSVSVATALESDLEPFQKLRKLELRRHSAPSLSQEYAFTLSSNPPNPRNTFRQGDWICASMNCAAHNFMRNLVCIGCGCPRPVAGPSPAPSNPPLWPRVVSSPRFAASSDFLPDSDFSDSYAPSSRALPRVPSTPSFSARSFSPHTPVSPTTSFSPTTFSPSTFSPTTSYPSSYSTGPSSYPTTPNPSAAAAAVALKLPSILTPSGRAFSIGGKVQNVSADPLAPCVLYWPDNEPLPEQGQIRPPGNVGAQPPPILNTGNKGPIEQQPGDWVCRKCDYLNWRRRKVCQTCFPYAEGNTDGVSASVQAERIAMLAQVLAASQPQPPHLLVQTSFQHSIPTPPNDSFALYSTPLPASPRALLPSFLSEDYDSLPSPATPPLSASSGSESPQSVHALGLASIWALRKDEK